MRTFAGFKDILDVVAVCDVDAAYLAEAKKLLPNARVYRDWRELLAAEGDRIDAVNVSTPDHTHTIVSANAMRRGKHVYCQKPLCKKLDECRLLRRLVGVGLVAAHAQGKAEHLIPIRDHQLLEGVGVAPPCPCDDVFLILHFKSLLMPAVTRYTSSMVFIRTI